MDTNTLAMMVWVFLLGFATRGMSDSISKKTDP